MKNLHKLTFTTAVLGVCLSSGVFAMEPFEKSEEMRNGGGTSAGQPRSSTAVATSSAISSDAYTVPQIGEQSYEHWLERRVASFASSELFLGIPEEDRERLQDSLLKYVIPRWQEISYHLFYHPDMDLFYHPGMERANPRLFNQLRCFNAELAILKFERQTIAHLVKKALTDTASKTIAGLVQGGSETYEAYEARVSREWRNIETSPLFVLVEHTENTYKAKEQLVRSEGQRIATQIVEILKDTPEGKAREARLAGWLS